MQPSKFTKLVSLLSALVCLNSNAAANEAAMRVTVTEQSSDGMSERDLTQGFLDGMAAYMKERVIKLSELTPKQEQLARNNLKSEAVYLTTDGKKLAVIRLSQTNPPLQSVVIGGFIGNQFARVSCQWDSTKRIPVTSGKCGKKVKSVFKLQ